MRRVTGNFDDNRFIESFRVSRALFTWLVEQISDRLQRTNHTAAMTTPVNKQIAIALYRWACGASYRVVGDVFAVGKTTVFKCSRLVANAVIVVLLDNTIRYPALDDVTGWREIADGFARRGIPNAVGAGDGTHFEISEPPVPPNSNSIEHPYMDRRSLFSIGAQAVVDADGCFRNFATGFPGSVHDGAFFSCFIKGLDTATHYFSYFDFCCFLL